LSYLKYETTSRIRSYRDGRGKAPKFTKLVYCDADIGNEVIDHATVLGSETTGSAKHSTSVPSQQDFLPIPTGALTLVIPARTLMDTAELDLDLD
jgi:hypothetical protein